MPAPAPLVSCDPEPPTPPSLAREALFFASNRLPRCVGASRYVLTGFRGSETVYGTSVLPDGATRWRHHISARHDRAAWFAALRARAAAVDPKRPLLVYIHGFNNGFDKALERGFVLSRLATPDTPVVVVSWPSRNKLESYTYDEATIEWTTDEFEALLRDLGRHSDDMTVVAHSMGNRAAIAAVMALDRANDPVAADIRRMVLASPDVDRDVALRAGGYLDRLLVNGQREVLVYTSSADRANRASHRVHGFARLGSTDCRFDVSHALQISNKNDCHWRPKANGLAIVDTGEVRSGLDRHADFVDSCAVRSDLHRFLTGHPAPKWRVSDGDDKRGGWRIDRAIAATENVLKCPE